jgi:hypothetical protein
MIRVQSLLGHADANTLLRYAHVQSDPLQDLLPLLYEDKPAQNMQVLPSCPSRKPDAL